MSRISSGTITITDTGDIERIYMVYAGSDSNTEPPDIPWRQWTEDINQVSGLYIWQRIVIKYSGIEITDENWQHFYSEPICVTGNSGHSVKSIETYYCNYGDGEPEEEYIGWSEDVPDYDAEKPNYWTKLIITYGDLDEKSIDESGQIIGFDYSEKYAVDEFQVTTIPKQELNGYEHPWIGGCGKNLLKLDIDDIIANNTEGTWEDNRETGTVKYTYGALEATLNVRNSIDITSIYIYLYGEQLPTRQEGFILSTNILILVNRNYVVSGGGNSSCYIKLGSLRPTPDEQLLLVDTREKGWQEFSWTGSDTTTDVKITWDQRVSAITSAIEMTFYPMLNIDVEEPLEFEPYSNTCPITGTQLNDTFVIQNQKNLWHSDLSSEEVNGIIVEENGDGSYNVSGTASADTVFFLSGDPQYLPAGDYIFNGITGGSISTYAIDIDALNISTESTPFVEGDNHFSLLEGTEINFFLVILKDTTINTTIRPMVRLASIIDPTYEKYVENISYPSTDEGIFGTWDLRKPSVGSGTVADATHRLRTIGSLNWTYSEPTTARPYGYFRASTGVLLEKKPGTTNVISSAFKTGDGYFNKNGTIFGSPDGSYIFIVEANYQDAQSFVDQYQYEQISYEVESFPFPQPGSFDLYDGINTIYTKDKDTLIAFKAHVDTDEKSIKISRDGGLTSSNEAAAQAQAKATEALSLSQTTRQHFWFLSQKEGTIDAGAYITDTPIDTFKNGKSGGYLLARSDGLELGKATNKFMTLSATALNFYRPGTDTVDATLTSDGLVLSRGGIEAGSKNTSDYIYIRSYDDATNHTLAINNSGDKSDWRIVAGNQFGVDKAGNLYASNANITGKITVDKGSNVYTTDDVNPLKIGGENLLQQFLAVNQPTSYNAFRIPLTENLVVGETYTLQLWGVSFNNIPAGGFIAVYWGGGSNNLTPWDLVPDSNGYICRTFTVGTPYSAVDAERWFINIYNSGPSNLKTARNMTLTGWKLERGNKATNWSLSSANTGGGINILRGTADMNSGEGSWASGTFRASGGSVSRVSAANPHPNGTVGALRITNNTSAAARIGFAQDSIPSNNLITDKIYTLSGWVRASASYLTIDFQPIFGSNSQTTYSKRVGVTDTTWTYYSATLRLQGTQATAYSGGYIYVNNVPADGWFEVCGLKLEEGPIATGWSAGTEADASNFITQIDANGIWVTPSGKKPTNTSTGANATGTKIDGDGVGIYVGGTKLAQYGTTTYFYEPDGTIAASLDGTGLNIKTGTITLGSNFSVTAAGVITAKSGTIGGWNFNSSSLYKNNATPGASTSTMVISTGTASTNNIGGGGTTSKNWMLSAGTGFGVTTNGILYASGAQIKGDITANSFVAKDLSGSTYRTRVVVDTNGLTIYDGSGTAASNIQARFGSTIQVGKKAVGYIKIASTGMDIYSGSNNIQLAHLGYASGTSSSGEVDIAPYFTFGIRANNSTIGNYSYVEGYRNTASGFVSHAEGSGTTANSAYAHAEGSGTTASGSISHAEGSYTVASGIDSHAEGSFAVASGLNSHAEGSSTEASGRHSHAEGENTKANGYASHAGGHYTIANGDYQTVIGRFNVSDTTSLFIIGDGIGSDDRSNAFTVSPTQAEIYGNLNVSRNLKVTSINGIPVGDSPKFTDTNTTYSAGSNITLSGTTFSLTKANVVGALGYTPPTTNTTYSAGSNITLSGTTFSLTKANVVGALGYTPPTTNTNTVTTLQQHAYNPSIGNVAASSYTTVEKTSTEIGIPSGWTVLGVVGWNSNKQNQVTITRLRYQSSTLYITVKNLTSSKQTSVTLYLDLLLYKQA